MVPSTGDNKNAIVRRLEKISESSYRVVRLRRYNTIKLFLGHGFREPKEFLIEWELSPALIDAKINSIWQRTEMDASYRSGVHFDTNLMQTITRNSMAISYHNKR